MNEVSCKVFGVFMKPLAERGVSLDSILVGTALTPAELRNRRTRIDWSVFAQIMRNIRVHFTEQDLVEIGRHYMRSPGLRFAFVIGRLLFTPMDFYRWFSKPRQGVGNQMFTCVIPTHRELSATEIELSLELPEGYEMCWEFFVTSSGNMEELPRLLGLPRAQLKLTRLPRGARMHIVVPQRIPFLTRIWRVLTFPLAARAAAGELKEAHEALLERYEELEDARGRLDRQATLLRTAHTINELVQRDLDLGRTLDTVAMSLVDEAGFTWSEIRLGDAERIAQFGDLEHEPPLTRTLEARGGQRLGEIAVAPRPDADRGERDQLLAFIVPTLSITLENALYRTNLEQLVDQRTAELRQARDQLAGTVVELREAQGARERFFGNISHEIRTPLAIIMLAAGDVQTRAGNLLDGRARAGLGAVTDAARKLVRLVDELLLLAAGQEGKLRTAPEPTDLAMLVEHLVAAWQPGAEVAGIALATAVPATLIANIDPVALERVATNLVSNALKYTPRGGRVDLELAVEDDGVRLSVLDTGPGISDELAGRLFGRFERADGEDRRKVGSGLGLSLAKQLVEAHGGTIRALARPTGGSELRVVLPLAVILREPAATSPAQLRLVDEPSAAAPAFASGTRLDPPGLSLGTILLAEDDERLAEMIAQLLSDEYTVVVAHDGVAAIDLVTQHQPQLLITDVDMPGMNGIELSRRFRELTNDRLAPIIILSAMLDLGTRIAGLDAGAVDYVTKPFDPIELKARVRAQFRMRELAMRLHRAEQLSALGILTSGLAHELRNPANGVVNALHPLAQLLPKELLDAEHPVGQLLEVIGGCAEQIGFLSRQLLGFRSGGVELELRPANLRDLIQRATNLAQGLTGVELRVDLAIDQPISCAPPLIAQVLTNLIENAAYAAGRGGWVEVIARVEGDRIVLAIGDSGGGVPRELRERVFEPFFTTKPPGIGNGLGLSLSRDIIHRHRGVLEIRERGGRAVFVIELPGQAAEDLAIGAANAV